MTTLASKVNQKLYHAELLLAVQAEQTQPALKAKQSALEGAISATLQSAFDLFVQELAEAVQVFGRSLSLSDLAGILHKEGRGFPVVDTLLVLQEASSSWVAQIQRAYQQFLEGDRHTQPDEALVIKTLNLDDAIDLPGSLSAFKAFVSDNRAFFAEW